MRVIFMGTPEFSVPVLDALVQAGHEICAVYTQPPRPAGRGKKPRMSPVQARAETLGLQTRHPRSLKSPEAQAEYAALNADIAVVVAYGLILPQAILDAPANGCLNIHASLLPRWRGAAPIHRAIMAGDLKTGVCIMQMDAGLDTGDVLSRHEIAIAPDETTGALHDRLSALGATAIVQALAHYAQLTPVPQPEEGITYANKIDKSEARIDWATPAQDLIRQINGLSPFPGAWCMAGEERIKLLSARPSTLTVASTANPGAITVVTDELNGEARAGLHVATKGATTGGTGKAEGGALYIETLQRAGKKPIASREIVRGWTPPARFT